MKQKTKAIFKVSSLDWRTGWVTELKFRLTSSDTLEIATKILDESGDLYSSKAVKVELDTPKPFSYYEFVVADKVSDLAKRDLTSLYLEGDSEDIHSIITLSNWSRDVLAVNGDLTPAETKNRPASDFDEVADRFDGSRRFELIANGERYLVLRELESREVSSGIFSVKSLEKVMGKEIFRLSKFGGSWSDWLYSILYDSTKKKALSCLNMGDYKVYSSLEGNPASMVARGLRYDLRAIFEYMNEEGVPNFPTGMWGDWIVQQYMIQGLKDFKMLNDKFTMNVNLKGKELAKFRQEMLEPWKVKDNNDPHLKDYWKSV